MLTAEDHQDEQRVTRTFGETENAKSRHKFFSLSLRKTSANFAKLGDEDTGDYREMRREYTQRNTIAKVEPGTLSLPRWLPQLRIQQQQKGQQQSTTRTTDRLAQHRGEIFKQKSGETCGQPLTRSQPASCYTPQWRRSPQLSPVERISKIFFYSPLTQYKSNINS